ncbi:MAG: outer membrane lipoprotein chaperone LolA [Rhodocyclaceae bacterium]|nr:outer membrane lipoprotein chaperone LolA [Rhodocyclaceae bacterium]
MKPVSRVLGVLILALGGLLATVPAQAGDVLSRLDRFLAEVGSGQGSFSQIVVSRSGRRPQRSVGEFAFARPGRFLWVYTEPYPQRLVSDGARLWSYDQDLNQVTVKPLGDALGATPAAILAGEGDLARNFAVSDNGRRDGLDWVVARPKAPDSPFTDMELGFDGAELRAMLIRDSFGQQTELRFDRFERNPSIDPALFRFVPPAGADVIGE